jgi:hypothetical protein
VGGSLRLEKMGLRMPCASPCGRHVWFWAFWGEGGGDLGGDSVSIGSLRREQDDTDDFDLGRCESDTRDSKMPDGYFKTGEGESLAMWKDAGKKQ